jgi:hypothetical protein
MPKNFSTAVHSGMLRAAHSCDIFRRPRCKAKASSSLSMISAWRSLAYLFEQDVARKAFEYISCSSARATSGFAIRSGFASASALPNMLPSPECSGSPSSGWPCPRGWGPVLGRRTAGGHAKNGTGRLLDSLQLVLTKLDTQSGPRRKRHPLTKLR